MQIELRISRMIEAFNIRVETRKEIVLQGMLNKQVALPKFRQSSSPAVSYPAVRMIGHENTTLQQYFLKPAPADLALSAGHGSHTCTCYTSPVLLPSLWSNLR